MYVRGRYPRGKDLDLSSSMAGTRYASSDPRIVTVDAEGNVVATGFGTAIVTVTNGSAKTFIAYVVEDSSHPLPPQDLTARVTFAQSPLKLDERESARMQSPMYVQTITITNASDLPIVGPLYLSVVDMPANVYVQLYGHPTPQVFYQQLDPRIGLTLAPGASVTTSLLFAMRDAPAQPKYGLGLIRSSSRPPNVPRARPSAP